MTRPHARIRLLMTAIGGLALTCIVARTGGAQQAGLLVDTVASALRVPKAIAILSEREAIVAANRYQLYRLNLVTGSKTLLTGGPPPVTPPDSFAETAIMDVLPHPDVTSNGVVFLSVVIGDTARSTLAVMRARVRDRELVDTSTLLVADAWERSGAHFGGSLAYRDGYLFVSVGERESRTRVQDLANHVGKTLRIRDDGRVPDDNPFVGRPGARAEIWTYGHRNPQGLAFDANGVLWANEHGPRHGDELNALERGRDYGWPRVSFGWEYSGGAVGSGFTRDSLAVAPLRVWTPAIAPSDLLIYSGRAFTNWRGHFFSTSLNARRQINRLEWNGTRFVVEEELFPNQLGRLRSVAEGPQGWIYVGNDGGEIIRLRPR